MSFSLRSFVCRTAILALAALTLCSSVAFGGDRKLKKQVSPVYPVLAKRSRVSGAVRLELLVLADGTVKNVKAIGGHPMLIEAAIEAVKMWKYEPGAETTLVVEIKFTLDGE